MTIQWTLILVVPTVLAFSGPKGPNVEVVRYTMDAGGGMRSSGGRFELSGTIGQPEFGVMSADGLSLIGGFWVPSPAGDCNRTGYTGLLDAAFFRSCLRGPGGQLADQGCSCFDLDRSGWVDLADYAILQSTFTTE
jgi:hypothetical protein